MTITLDISPEAEKRLQRRASLAGVPLPQLLAGLVEQASLVDVAPATLPLPPMPALIAVMTPAQRVAALNEMISHSPSGPSLPDDAFDRGELYG